MLLPGQTKRRTGGGVRRKTIQVVLTMYATTNGMKCRVSDGIMWLQCPVCRRGKLLKLIPETRAQGLVLFCKYCKHEVTVEIGAGVCRETCRRQAAAVS